MRSDVVRLFQTLPHACGYFAERTAQNLVIDPSAPQLPQLYDLAVLRGRRDPIRYCLDWSEQRHHLAGPLGAAVTDRVFALGWLRRTDRRRVVVLTDVGRDGFGRLGVPDDWDAAA